MISTVTIMIPAYNAADSVERLLLSLENQDYPKEATQILIIDDASKDATVGIIENFKTKASLDIELLKNKVNKGNGPTKNDGIAAASGDVLFFLDDHCWIPSKTFITDAVAYLKLSEAAGVCGAYRVSDDSDWNVVRDIRRNYFYNKASETKITLKNFTTFSIVVSAFKTKEIKQYLFPINFGQHGAEDTLLQLQLLRDGKQLNYNPKLFVYHDHAMGMQGLRKKIFIEINGLGDLLIASHKEQLGMPFTKFFLDYSVLPLLSIILFSLWPILFWVIMRMTQIVLKTGGLKQEKLTTVIKTITYLFVSDAIKSIWLPIYIVKKKPPLTFVTWSAKVYIKWFFKTLTI